MTTQGQLNQTAAFLPRAQISGGYERTGDYCMASRRHPFGLVPESERGSGEDLGRPSNLHPSHCYTSNRECARPATAPVPHPPSHSLTHTLSLWGFLRLNFVTLPQSGKRGPSSAAHMRAPFHSSSPSLLLSSPDFPRDQII